MPPPYVYGTKDGKYKSVVIDGKQQFIIVSEAEMACRDGDPNGYIYSYPNPDWGGPPVVAFRREPSLEEMNDELRPTWPCDPWQIGHREYTGLTDSAFKRIGQLEDAIRNHRDQRGDDRCWMDDETLYKVLPEGYTAPARDTEVELKLCEKFISCRKNPATAYVSPQRRIEELEKELRELKTVRFNNILRFGDEDKDKPDRKEWDLS